MFIMISEAWNRKEAAYANSISSLRLFVPPMDEQIAFVKFVVQTDKSKVAIQAALDKSQLLFDGLMQKYFG